MSGFDPAAHLDAVAAGLGLTIEAEWRPVVLEHLAAIARAAELVMGFELPEDAEPAPRFEPGR